MMKLSDMIAVAAKRTTSPNLADVIGVLLKTKLTDYDLAFITMCSNNWDKIEKVLVAAKNIKHHSYTCDLVDEWDCICGASDLDEALAELEKE